MPTNKQTTSTVQEIAVSKIELGDRLRPISKPHAFMLAKNIEQAGRVRQPIQVRPIGKDRYRVTFGAHRWHAVAVILKWETIPAIVRQCSADEALLDEIDENLHRYELSCLDKSRFLGVRAEAYLRLHPETKRGGKNQHTKVLTDTVSFSKETAERTGLSDKTIRRYLAIYRGFAPLFDDQKLHEKLANSALAARQADLLALSRLEPTKRKKALDGLLAAEPRWTSVRQAIDAVDNRNRKKHAATSPEEKVWAAFVRLTPAKQRNIFDRIADHLRPKNLKAAE